MRRAALRAIAGDRSLRRVVTGFGVFAAAEAAAWIALLVYAYEHGGVVEVGIAAGALLAPAALLAPLAGPFGDRFRRDRVLAAGYAVQAACLALMATSLTAGAERLFVYLTGGALTLAVTLTPPAIGALLPSLAREPEELATANAALGALESLGALLGPLAAAALLLSAGPAAVFAAGAAGMAFAALGAARLHLDPRLTRPLGHATSLRESIADGVAFLGRDLDVLLLVSCVAAPSLLLGAVEVLLVAVASEQLGQGSHFAGYLSAVFGIGGVVGAGAALMMVGRRLLALALCLAGLVAGAPIAGLAVSHVAPVAFACLLASGIGHSFGGVVGTTLIQRASPDRFRASVFGVLEGFETASLALGALLVSALSTWLDLAGTLLAVGALVPLVLLLSAPRLLAIDAGASAPETRVLSALRRDPIFSTLAAPHIERLAGRALLVSARSGDEITREGELGDRFYCILDGDLEVQVGGQLVRTLGRGDSFGEIALLHAVPRTASVSTRGPATLVAVEGRDFLETVTRHPQSLVQANAGARRLLSCEWR